MQHNVIIVAGGLGRRMGSGVPKQFMLVKGEPVLFHTVRAFHSFDPDIRLIIVLPKEHQSKWKELCEEYVICAPHDLADGGEERFHSVKAGLDLVTGNGLVAVHDGVRPVLSTELIERCFQAADAHGAAIPVVPIASSVREIDGDRNHAIDRSRLRIVQTPQCFRSEILKKAFEQPYDPAFTDEATLVERSGVPVHLVAGDERNLKITTAIDLKVAELLL